MNILSRRLRQWLVFLLLISLLFPILLAGILVGLGNALGCQIFGQADSLCWVSGLNLGQSIKALVDWTWYFPVLSLFATPFLGLAFFIGILLLIYKSFRGVPRLLIGIFSIWYMFFAPVIAGIIFVATVAGKAQCSINEGGVGACYVFGLDMGSTFHAAATLPWLIFILFPLCVLASLIYLVIGLIHLKPKASDTTS